MLSGKAPQQYNQRQRQVAQLKPRDSRWTTAHVCVKCCQLVWVLVLPLTDSSTFSQQPLYSSPAFRHFLSWTLNVESSLPILNSPFEAVRNSAQALRSTLSPTSSLLLFSSPHLVIDGLPEASRASEPPPSHPYPALWHVPGIAIWAATRGYACVSSMTLFTGHLTKIFPQRPKGFTFKSLCCLSCWNVHNIFMFTVKLLSVAVWKFVSIAYFH